VNEPLISIERDFPLADPERARDRAYWLRDAIERGRARLARDIPPRYADAMATDPEVVAWVRSLVSDAARDPISPSVGTGRSLLLLGGVGVGKTYQAYGAIRALVLSGAACSWMVTTAADVYARLRPRHKVDSEEEFNAIATVRVLVIDDLGAAKNSEWVEEVNYRLINQRYERMLPTLITSNVPQRELRETIGDRVASRLVEMAARVALKGEDRRRSNGQAA
jgi:DNA replication protein DnaC